MTSTQITSKCCDTSRVDSCNRPRIMNKGPGNESRYEQVGLQQGTGSRSGQHGHEEENDILTACIMQPHPSMRTSHESPPHPLQLSSCMKLKGGREAKSVIGEDEVEDMVHRECDAEKENF